MNIKFTIMILAFISLTGCTSKVEPELRDGDIIFQTSNSSQSRAVQLATNSTWSHMGILFRQNKRWQVLEASRVVQVTPLETWIKHGANSHYTIKRLKAAPLSAEQLQKMKQVAMSLKGKPYDQYFGWSDEKFYCSELVWKIYKNALGIELGSLSRMRNFNISNEVVAAKLKERYGKNIPTDETVISPSNIYASELLETVKQE